MREVKDIVASVGTLAMWWVVGYSLQAAARVMTREERWVPQGTLKDEQKKAA
ncbi:MAG: hypothetical protein ACKO6N_00660 [Myxococcota bacterium]